MKSLIIVIFSSESHAFFTFSLIYFTIFLKKLQAIMYLLKKILR